MASTWPRLRLPVVSLLLAGLAVAVPQGAAVPRAAAAVEPAAATSGAHASIHRAALAAPDTALGSGWRSSTDVAVTGAGDENGYHLYVAREKDAFAWSTLATLRSSGPDLGVWTGQVCVTGSGRYAVAVYAPATAANVPALIEAGGLAAVVDIATGKARSVASGVQLAYFNPACGVGDRVLLTRAIGADEQQTDLLTVDAASAKVTQVRRIHGQLTTPVPAADADYGIAGGGLVRVSATGAVQQVARPHGTVFGIAATAGNGIDVISGIGRNAFVERYAKGSLRRIGTGPTDTLQLFGLPGGRDAVVGDVRAMPATVPGMLRLSADRQVAAVSAQGHLLAERVASRAVTEGVAASYGGRRGQDSALVDLTVRATRSGRLSSGAITTAQAPTLAVDVTAATDAAATSAAPGTSPAKAAPAPKPAAKPAPKPAVKAAASPAAVNDSTPTCAVPRNDPTIQPLQPSPNMVEWAVDQAVHGNLAVQKSMFKLAKIDGGGTVPAQVILGILAQESNLSQASFHAVPGDTGNPEISDYYGNRAPSGDHNVDVINYNNADCGYGIGQVTTGMSVGETLYTPAQQVAIASDYKANIAAAVNALIDKWNQLYTEPQGRLWVNSGDAAYIENWYLALWAYNTGYHASTDPKSGGYWGVGWLNNPANNSYPYNRHRFLADYNDATHPSDWSYEERVMGWIEVPQKKGDGDAYAKPNFAADKGGGSLYLPNDADGWPRQFCEVGINNCDPLAATNADPCPAENSTCWWKGHEIWTGCPHGCSTEVLTYGAGSSEPPLQRIYPLACDDIPLGQDQYIIDGVVAPIVYDLNDTNQYALGCGVHPSNGKFTLRLSSPAGSQWQYGEVDLHQLGAGFQGHIWFTHVYPPNPAMTGDNTLHKVVGTWTPDLDTTRTYDVIVHVPSHGGAYATADYVIQADPRATGDSSKQDCILDQRSNGADKWKYLGAYTLKPGAQVMLSNVGDGLAQGTVDIAYDAMAFIPINGPGHKCNTDF